MATGCVACGYLTVDKGFSISGGKPEGTTCLQGQAPVGEACRYHWLVGDQVYLTQLVFVVMS